MNKINKVKKYISLILLSAITVAVTTVFTFNYYLNSDGIPADGAINSATADIQKKSSQSDELGNESKTLQHTLNQTPKSRLKAASQLRKSIIGTTKEFKIGGQSTVKGKVIDFYATPSKKALKSRVTVIDAEGMKYNKLRIEETYKVDDQEQETILATTVMVADHVIVKVRPEVSEKQLRQVIDAHGLKIRKKMFSGNMYLIETPEAEVNSVPEALLSLSEERNVRLSDPDYIVYSIATPDDASFNDLWGMHNTGQTSGTADADIDAVEAWDVFSGSRAVVVGIIDTGINYGHPDLAANIWTNPDEIAGNGIDDDGNGLIDDIHGYDFANNDGDPNDDNSHGSHCAGTIGGVGNNGTGVTGVNWQVSMMALKFLSGSGSGAISDAIDCVNYATDKGVHLTSNSWGGGGFSSTMKEALETAEANNILFVAAAGNDGSNNDGGPHYPSNYEVSNVISVAATDHNDQLAGFSNYGAVSVDLGAPGVGIYSTVLGTGYDSYNGTSMATPHVAGVCALLKGYDSGLTAAQIKFIVLNSGDQIASLAGITTTGRRLNAMNALNMSGSSILVLNRPVEGKNYISGMTVNIDWASLNVEGEIKIELFKDGVLNTEIAGNTTNDGSFEWVVPNSFALGNYVLKVTSVDDSSLSDQSNISVVLENFPKSLDGWVEPTGSDAAWDIASDEASQGVLSLKSGNINDSQASAIEYSGNFAAGQVSFDRKISSESGYDYLVFYIDGVEQGRWSGSVNWSTAAYNISSGLHTFKWQYQKDSSVSSGADSAWIDEVSFPDINTEPIVDLIQPLDGSSYISGMDVNILWSSFNVKGDIKIELLKNDALHTTIADSTVNDGAFNWVVPDNFALGNYVLKISSLNDPSLSDQSSISIILENFPKTLDGWVQSAGTDTFWSIVSDEASQGVLSLKSDDIDNSQSAGAEFTANFRAGNVTFDKKVSSESSWDYLVFYIDDVEQGRWSGTVDWSNESYPVTAGNHTFKWQYEKDSSVSTGADSAWIDEVSFPPINSTPVIETAASANPQSIPVNGSTELSVVVSDSEDDPLTYLWEKVSGPGEVNFDNSISAVTAASFTEIGTYELKVTISDSLLEVTSTTSVTVTPYQIISENGSFNIVQESRNVWHSVNLAKNYENPVIIFSPVTTNGGQPAHIRVKNVAGNSFDWQIEEWAYLDGYHLAEKVDYIVLEAGTYNLPDGRSFVAGNVASKDSYTAHSFGDTFQTTPVVVTQLVSAQDATPATVRLHNIQAGSFNLKLQSEEAKGKVHGDEIVSYIAVETGTYQDAGLLESDTTGVSVDHNWFNLQFTGTYEQTPSFFASFQTTNGGDTADLRIKSLNSSQVDVKVHEEQSKDSETRHIKEKLGYILFNLNN